MFGRQRVAALVAEFLGAGALTLLVLTAVRSPIGSITLFVAAVAGLLYMLMSFAVGAVSGGHFNPALTLALWTARKVETVTAVLYVAAQLLGAWGAYYLYTYLANNTLQQIHVHFTWRIFTAEALGAGIFAFGFAAALYQGLTRAVTASFAGLSYLLGILVASTASLALLNPALALGVRAWDWGAYVAAPLVGAIIGANLYTGLFAGENLFGLTRASTVKAAPAVTKRSPAKRKTASRRKK
jgi:aquaporin Z